MGNDAQSLDSCQVRPAFMLYNLASLVHAFIPMSVNSCGNAAPMSQMLFASPVVEFHE